MKTSKDYTWALFLIFLGIVFLLNTTGVLSWDIWLYILNYWPVLLILTGLKMILGDSRLSRIIIFILSLSVFLWIGLCSYSRSNEIHNDFLPKITDLCQNTYIADSETKTENFLIERSQYPEAEELEYYINLGLSEFSINDGINEFINLQAEYTTNHSEPIVSEVLNGDILRIDVTEENRGLGFLNFNTSKYHINIGSDLLSNIYITNGVGSGDINFTNQFLNNLSITTGTGDIDLEFGVNSLPTKDLTLKTETGSISLSLPPDTGYMITYNIGVGEIKIEGDKIGGIGTQGENIKSPNYDDATNSINIITDIGVGNLSINFNNK